MVIKCNTEGKKAIETLCDVALKAGGLNNLQYILDVLQKIETLPVEAE